ncbi:MAG: type II secretion system protein [Sulfuricurvum sp.]|uniref:type II secretion system protein n=1 Tax=Sulfuricurvum sp. TaxID=2025608 RepID=UPI00262D03B3|nr:type II secretion system protein [Sulfuricurvum sp.]MDD2368803.1 type II secretion system protein [Sulfuricurvum sp.]MDD5117536.1 type II secretion system protein [Sulfuricurvum sp.]
MKLRSAFTMTELIFVIVVIGILASIALPRIGNSITDAQLARGTADVAAIRSAILAERQRLLLQGVTNFVPDINNNFTAAESNATRTLLTYPLKMGKASGEWEAAGDGLNFTYHVDDRDNNPDAVFTYNPNNGQFTCVEDATNKADECTRLTR